MLRSSLVMVPTMLLAEKFLRAKFVTCYERRSNPSAFVGSSVIIRYKHAGLSGRKRFVRPIVWIILFCFCQSTFRTEIWFIMSCFSPLNTTDKIKRFLAEFYVDGDEGKLFKYGEQLVSEVFVNNSCLSFEGFLTGVNFVLCNRATENILSFTSIMRIMSLRTFCWYVVFCHRGFILLETQTFLPFQVKIAHREQVELLVELDDISEVK